MSESEKQELKGELHPRPLSPHLQVYRLQLTSVLSITHRFTGVALILGLGLLVYWLGMLSKGPEHYLDLVYCLKSPFVQILLVGWTFSLYYHLANGVRHLFWDMGKGFALKDTYFSGWLVVVLSVLATALTWTKFYSVL